MNDEKEISRSFFVLRDESQIDRDPEQVYLIAFAEDKSIVASLRLSCPVGHLGDYECKTDDTAMLEQRRDELVRAVRAPVWGEVPSAEELKQAGIDYDGSLARDFIELALLIKDADGIFRKCLSVGQPKFVLPTGQDEVLILSEEERDSGYRLAGMPISDKSRHLKQSSCTFDPVMRVLYSAVKLQGPLESIVTVPEAKEFYGQLENALRFITDIRKSRLPKFDARDKLFATSSDAVYAATLIPAYQSTQPEGNEEPLWKFVGLLKNIRGWLYVGEKQVEDLIAKLREWQKKWNADRKGKGLGAGKGNISVMAIARLVMKASQNISGPRALCEEIDKIGGEGCANYDYVRNKVWPKLKSKKKP